MHATGFIHGFMNVISAFEFSPFGPNKPSGFQSGRAFWSSPRRWIPHASDRDLGDKRVECFEVQYSTVVLFYPLNQYLFQEIACFRTGGDLTDKRSSPCYKRRVGFCNNYCNTVLRALQQGLKWFRRVTWNLSGYPNKIGFLTKQVSALHVYELQLKPPRSTKHDFRRCERIRCPNWWKQSNRDSGHWKSTGNMKLGNRGPRLNTRIHCSVLLVSSLILYVSLNFKRC